MQVQDIVNGDRDLRTWSPSWACDEQGIIQYWTGRVYRVTDRSIVWSVDRLSFDDVDSWQYRGWLTPYLWGQRCTSYNAPAMYVEGVRDRLMWPRHRSNKASHNGRAPGTLDWWTARNGGRWWCVGAGGREGRGLTALDILPATRGYHQWDSMRDHVLLPRYPEKCCLPDSGCFSFYACTALYAQRERERGREKERKGDACRDISGDFQVLSYLSFIIHQVVRHDMVPMHLPKVRKITSIS